MNYATLDLKEKTYCSGKKKDPLQAAEGLLEFSLISLMQTFLRP